MPLSLSLFCLILPVQEQEVAPRRSRALVAEIRKLTLDSKGDIDLEDWIQANVKADNLCQDFISEVQGLNRADRKAEWTSFGTSIGSGTAEQDLFWLMSAPYILTLPYRHFCIDTQAPVLFEMRTQISEAQTKQFLSNRLARLRFAHSVAWMDKAISSESLILWEIRRLLSKETVREAGAHYGRSAFPRDAAGKPKPEYWWDARLAVLLRMTCDSDVELEGWTAGRIDEHFRVWAKEWLAAKEAGLVRPGRKFGWRVDRRPDVKPVRAMPPPTIPKQPFDGCQYPPMDDYLKNILFSY